MMSIYEGCLALLINDADNTGEVTVGVCAGNNVKTIWGTLLAFNNFPIWKIDRKLVWRDRGSKLIVMLAYCPQNKLMRIDGFEN